MSSRLSFHRPMTGAALLALALAACTSQPPQPATIEETVEVSATVEAIDVQKRLLSLVGPDGEKITVEVSPTKPWPLSFAAAATAQDRRKRPSLRQPAAALLRAKDPPAWWARKATRPCALRASTRRTTS